MLEVCCGSYYDWLGVDRVLSSGLKPTALEGKELLKELQKQYGAHIEILAGSGINISNVSQIIKDTGISQVHSSCKEWKKDNTTVSGDVSYSYAAQPNNLCYDVVSAERVREIIKVIGE